MNALQTVLGAVALAVCVCAGGCGGAHVEQHITTVSKGRELTDLQRALDEGAITQSDFDHLRSAVVRRPD